MQLDPSYSPDIEIDHDGRVVFARDLPPGAVIEVPVHMLEQIRRQQEEAGAGITLR